MLGDRKRVSLAGVFAVVVGVGEALGWFHLSHREANLVGTAIIIATLFWVVTIALVVARGKD